MISYSRAPLGACTDATSPSDLPISARAIGELIETRPWSMSASSSPTIWYFTVLARIQVFQFDRRAEHHAAVRFDGGRIDDLRAGQLRLDLGNAALDKALLFLGRVVFGVFRQIALRARFRDRIDDRRTLNRFQALQFVAQQFCAALRQWNCAHKQLIRQKTAVKKLPRLSASPGKRKTPLNRGLETETPLERCIQLD